MHRNLTESDQRIRGRGQEAHNGYEGERRPDQRTRTESSGNEGIKDFLVFEFLLYVWFMVCDVMWRRYLSMQAHPIASENLWMTKGSPNLIQLTHVIFNSAGFWYKPEIEMLMVPWHVSYQNLTYYRFTSLFQVIGQISLWNLLHVFLALTLCPAPGNWPFWMALTLLDCISGQCQCCGHSQFFGPVYLNQVFGIDSSKGHLKVMSDIIKL